MTDLISGSYSPSVHAILPAAVGVSLLMLSAIVLIRNRASLESMIFTLMLLAGTVWQFSYVGLFMAADPQTAWYWVRLEHAGVVFIPSFLYLFASLMVRRAYRCRFYLIGWFLASCFFLGSVFAGSSFIADIHQDPWGYYARYGILGKIFVALFLVSMAGNLKLYWNGCRQSGNPERKKIFFTLFLAFLVAQLGAVDFLAVFGVPVYPAGSVAVLAFVLILTRLVWKTELSEITASSVADSLVDAYRDLLFVTDRKGIIQIANRSAAHFFNRDPMAMAGMPLAEFLGVDLMLDKPQRLILKNHGGEARYMRVYRHAFTKTERNGSGVIWVASDETARIRATEQIRDQETQFQAMIRSIVDCAIMRIGPEGFIESSSQGAGLLFASGDAGLINAHFSILFPEKIRNSNEPTEILLQAAQQGSYTKSGRFMRSDGSYFSGKIVLQTIRAETNKILGFSAIVHRMNQHTDSVKDSAHNTVPHRPVSDKS